MESAEIRRRWLNFFAERDHTVVESASLVADDPTLLLINAGMVPFKPYFLGEATPPYRRATSVQKCVRTVDIDEVGFTARHNSFFQMCGNFSFGDYFKEKAIPMAWELLTTPVSEGGFGLEESLLWVTVYQDDDEAYEIWRRDVGVPEERIQRLGAEENYWSMGVPGPCGPCSEIVIDRGPEFGPGGGPAVNEERYMEVWNLVFMESLRGEGGAKKDYPILGELPNKNIDTGLGLERLAMVLQDVPNLFEIDTTRPLLDRAAELAETRYGADPKNDVALRIVADHIRTAVMLIGDGVLPSNEGRGYVLRRMMRRAIRNMRLLGSHDPTVRELVDTTIRVMSPQYPELESDRGRIEDIAVAEESSFLQTLKTGTTILDTAVTETKRAGGSVLPGDKAFQLHDTYGFPIDLTLEMAAEQGLSVDEEGFRRLMAEQRERAKADAKAKKQGYADLSVYREIADRTGNTIFTGYTDHEGEARVRGLLVDGVSAPAARAGDKVELVLDRTPFYAEAGGQLADKGTVVADGRGIVDIDDVQKPIGGLFVHRGTVRSGEIVLDDEVHASIDTDRRSSVSRSHSATHLIHSALRNALGPSTGQAGSENQPGRLRFDFTANKALHASDLAEVEEEVNTVLSGDIPVRDFETSLDEALAMGALAMFGQKYGDRVRVVEMSDYSRELCGGTHVGATGQLGVVKLLGESSIGSGVRRVEAAVGIDAFRQLSTESMLLSQLSEQLKTSREDLPQRIESMVSRLRAAEKEVERLRAERVLQAAASLVEQANDVNGVTLVTHRAPDGTTAEDLRKLVLDVRGRLDSGRPAAVAAFAVTNERPITVVATNEAARDERGLKAGELVRVAAKALGGGGGGKDDVAQGGGSDPESVDAAMSEIHREVAAA